MEARSPGAEVVNEMSRCEDGPIWNGGQGTVEVGPQHCGKVGGESEEPKVTSDFSAKPLSEVAPMQGGWGGRRATWPSVLDILGL